MSPYGEITSAEGVVLAQYGAIKLTKDRGVTQVDGLWINATGSECYTFFAGDDVTAPGGSYTYADGSFVYDISYRSDGNINIKNADWGVTYEFTALYDATWTFSKIDAWAQLLVACYINDTVAFGCWSNEMAANPIEVEANDVVRFSFYTDTANKYSNVDFQLDITATVPTGGGTFTGTTLDMIPAAMAATDAKVVGNIADYQILTTTDGGTTWQVATGSAESIGAGEVAPYLRVYDGRMVCGGNGEAETTRIRYEVTAKCAQEMTFAMSHFGKDWGSARYTAYSYDVETETTTKLGSSACGASWGEDQTWSFEATAEGDKLIVEINGGGGKNDAGLGTPHGIFTLEAPEAYIINPPVKPAPPVVTKADVVVAGGVDSVYLGESFNLSCDTDAFGSATIYNWTANGDFIGNTAEVTFTPDRTGTYDIQVTVNGFAGTVKTLTCKRDDRVPGALVTGKDVIAASAESVVTGTAMDLVASDNFGYDYAKFSALKYTLDRATVSAFPAASLENFKGLTYSTSGNYDSYNASGNEQWADGTISIRDDGWWKVNGKEYGFVWEFTALMDCYATLVVNDSTWSNLMYDMYMTVDGETYQIARMQWISSLNQKIYVPEGASVRIVTFQANGAVNGSRLPDFSFVPYDGDENPTTFIKHNQAMSAAASMMWMGMKDVAEYGDINAYITYTMNGETLLPRESVGAAFTATDENPWRWDLGPTNTHSEAEGGLRGTNADNQNCWRFLAGQEPVVTLTAKKDLKVTYTNDAFPNTWVGNSEFVVTYISRDGFKEVIIKKPIVANGDTDWFFAVSLRAGDAIAIQLTTTATGRVNVGCSPDFTLSPADFDAEKVGQAVEYIGAAVTQVATRANVSIIGKESILAGSGESFSFEARTDAKNVAMNYEWFVNGESVGTDATYSFKPTKVGTYSVYVVVNGIQSNAKTVTVISAPITEVKVAASDVTFGQLIKATATVNENADSDIVYTWYVNGEFYTSTGATFEFVPSAPGEYKIKAAAGGVESKEVTVKVGYPTITDFNIYVLNTQFHKGATVVLQVETLELLDPAATITWKVNGANVTADGNVLRIELNEDIEVSVTIGNVTKTVKVSVEDGTVEAEGCNSSKDASAGIILGGLAAAVVLLKKKED